MNRHPNLKPAAWRDLKQHYRFLAVDRPDVAERFIDKAFATMDLLMRMPEMGTFRPGKRRGMASLRFQPVDGFEKILIFYRLVPRGIEVIRVLHAALDDRRYFR
jgi:plasmid stabilization system protein ParE